MSSPAAGRLLFKKSLNGFSFPVLVGSEIQYSLSLEGREGCCRRRVTPYTAARFPFFSSSDRFLDTLSASKENMITREKMGWRNMEIIASAVFPSIPP